MASDAGKQTLGFKSPFATIHVASVPLTITLDVPTAMKPVTAVTDKDKSAV
jgi:hypothetical protein